MAFIPEKGERDASGCGLADLMVIDCWCLFFLLFLFKRDFLPWIEGENMAKSDGISGLNSCISKFSIEGVAVNSVPRDM